MTFSHGMEGDRGIGATFSTKEESTMKNVISVSFTDGNDAYSRTAASGNSSFCKVYTFSLKGRTGTHSCKYYVNGKHKKDSGAPWPFP